MTTSPPPTPRRLSAPRAARPALALGALLLLAACGSVGVGGGDDSDSAAGGSGAAALAAAAGGDARTLAGPSTALLASTALEPIADDPAPRLPATVTDVQGTVVTVTDASRILAVDLYGTTSRIVYELGLGDAVVGRDTSSEFAEIADKPVVTRNGHELNGEAILALAPTVIVTDTTLGPWDVMLQMRDAGIPVVVVDPGRSVEGSGGLIRQVAAALGVPDDGERLAARTEQRIDEERARIAAVVPADPADRLRMVFLYVRGQSGVYYMFGRGSGADSLISALGGVDVASQAGWEGMKPVTDEGLVAARPDLVLTMTDGLASTGGVDGLLAAIPALAQTPAGERRRIVDMADTEILGFGPETAAILDALAVAIYAPTPS